MLSKNLVLSRIITYFIFLNFLFPIVSLSQVSNFKEIILGNEFVLYKKYGDLPESIRAYLDSLNGGKIKIADVGKRFEASDNIYDQNLPRKRVLFIANFDKYWILGFECGGRGHHAHYLFIENSTPINILAISGNKEILRPIYKFPIFKEKLKTFESKLGVVEHL